MDKRKFKLSEIVKMFSLQVKAGKQKTNNEIAGGYASDLLSDVIAHCKKGDIWITLQGHPNIVAVAVLKEIAGIIIINGRMPEPETIKKAEAENVPIMTSELPAFELAGKLYALGISGIR